MAQSCAACVFGSAPAHRAGRGRRFGRLVRRRLPGWAERDLRFQRERVDARPLVFVVALDEEPGVLPLALAPLQPDQMEAAAGAAGRAARIAGRPCACRRPDRRAAPSCRGPRSRPCRRRTAPPGSCPGSRRSRADGPRHAPRAAGRRDRARVPCAPPSSTARRRARAAGPSAARRAWPRASAPRTAAPPCPAWVRAGAGSDGDREVALGAVGPDRGVADRGGFRHERKTCGAGAISTPCPKRPSSSGCEQLDVIGKSRRHAVVVTTLLARGGTPWRPRSPSRPAPPSGCRAEAVSECPSPSCADPASAPSPRV